MDTSLFTVFISKLELDKVEKSIIDLNIPKESIIIMALLHDVQYMEYNTDYEQSKNHHNWRYFFVKQPHAKKCQ